MEMYTQKMKLKFLLHINIAAPDAEHTPINQPMHKKEKKGAKAWHARALQEGHTGPEEGVEVAPKALDHIVLSMNLFIPNSRRIFLRCK